MILFKKAILPAIGLSLFFFSSFAQKKNFTIAEATNGMGTTLALQSVKQPSWQPGTDKFWQLVDNGKAWIYTDASKDKTDTVIRLQQLNEALKENMKTLPAFKWIDKEYVYFMNGSKVELGLLAGNGFNWGQWTTLPENAENVMVHKSRQIAFTIDNNLWVVNKDKKAIQVTNEKDRNIICGQAVHRNEFGIDGGIFFSPDGNYIAYYRMDQTMVNDYPIIKWGTAPAKADITKYPMAGGTSHQVTLCIYSLGTGETVTMQTGEPKEQYLTSVTWSPDEKEIYIGLLNRGQDHLSLNQYDTHTGRKLKTLFEEKSTKYVHPTHTLSFLPDDNEQFIWWSEKDGYEHLYLYNTSGKLLNQITKGKWVVNEILGFNKEKHELIISSSKESPTEKNIYTVDWNSGGISRVDKGEGMHSAICSEDGKYILDVLQGKGIPKKSTLRAVVGKYEKVLIDAPNTLADYERPLIKDINLKAADGKTVLYGKLILPTQMDSSKKYPVIVYLYNGPNVQLIHNGFPESGNLWYEYMAQRGYVVFTMDGRGSWNRGLDFEQSTFRNLGEVEMEDQLKGVEYLKKLPFVDSNLMGVHGWSYGGFMTTSLMLHHPGVFKCAVAGGPVMDWKMYEIMYTERYMDSPQENPDGYENANLLTKTAKLKGKLLLIHGTDDNVVVWQHSINFVKKCVDEGVQVDYFVYPGYEHNVRGKDRVHLMTKISEYFDAYLKP